AAGQCVSRRPWFRTASGIRVWRIVKLREGRLRSGPLGAALLSQAGSPVTVADWVAWTPVRSGQPAKTCLSSFSGRGRRAGSTVDRLKRLIADRGFTVFNVIDHSGVAERVGG